MADPLPLLRSPPFPGIDPRVAAVSLPGVAASRAVEQPALFDHIRAARIGGCFWARQPTLPETPFALLCARSVDDARSMLASAPSGIAIVLHLPHPARLPGVTIWDGDVDPWPVLERADVIHAHGDSEWAALARIAGRPVTLHSPGMFDTAAGVAAALLATPYRNPFTGRVADIDFVIDLLSDWRRLIDANRSIVAAAGIAWWKRDQVKAFLWAPRMRPLLLTRSTDRAIGRARQDRGAIAIWPSRVRPRLVDRAGGLGVPLVRIEDGFVRSVGLGSNLVPPLSVAVDARGIYYDPAGPSDLEHLLETTDFTPALLERAEILRADIIAAGISKYGAGAETGRQLPERPLGRKLILVPGQVEDDESVRLAGGEVGGNLDLLRRARALEPDAAIWFRPHPDVDAGHRVGAIPQADALRYADRVVVGGSMVRLLDMVDGVHVLTSLAGFEALIREREVVVHGLPFYAGWGLTRDMAAMPVRRSRRLALPALIAGALILYPRYLDPLTRLPCSVETLVSRFGENPAPRGSWLTLIRKIQGKLMRKSP